MNNFDILLLSLSKTTYLFIILTASNICKLIMCRQSELICDCWNSLVILCVRSDPRPSFKLHIFHVVSAATELWIARRTSTT